MRNNSGFHSMVEWYQYISLMNTIFCIILIAKEGRFYFEKLEMEGTKMNE